MEESLSTSFVQDVRTIIDTSRQKAVRSVNSCRVEMYWNLGKRIFEEEQHGKQRADYGTFLIQNLAKEIEPQYGSGFSVRQLQLCRQFYRTFPIANTLYAQLNWSQYKLLISIDDPDKREYYMLEAVNNAWTKRELERQINSLLYERRLLSNDKENVLAVARKERIPENPEEIIKGPMVLEFLGLPRLPHYYEREIESAIINHITEFLLEMGKGFSFVGCQKRILIEDDEFFADLVFYNRVLRCFVVIELKTDKITHQDIGQLQMYMNYFDRCEKWPDENPTIGILLGASKNDTAVKMTLPLDNRTIFAAKYEMYLPSTEQLIKEVNQAKKMVAQKKDDGEDGVC
ncbi:MAG: PDDEXK nuclease domain-containing protein [Bacteroidales bacterium]|nr:PDDEXK nuclease domain-containing protein [Bacteroidales bacterium]